MKRFIKNIILKLLRRVGALSPIHFSWEGMHDHQYMGDVLKTMRLAKFYEPREVDLPLNKKVLVLSPHPDDETIGAGGSIIQMIEKGCDVHVLQFTLGDDERVYEESLDVARALNFEPHYLRFNVDEMDMDQVSLEKFAQSISAIEPDIVFIPFVLDDNDDHRRVNEYLEKAISSKALKLNGETQVWAYQVYSFFPVNAVVKITEQIEKKCEAMRLYKSQFEVRDWTHFLKGMNAFNIRFLTGKVDEEYVEIFYTSSLKHYLSMCRSYFGDDASRCYSNPYYSRKT